MSQKKGAKGKNPAQMPAKTTKQEREHNLTRNWMRSRSMV